MSKLIRYFVVSLVAILHCNLASASSFLTFVTNTAALSALSVAGGPLAVLRLGYNTAGDGGIMVYIPQSSACSLNTGAGDNGSQVKSVDGLCWVWAPYNFKVTPQVFGAVWNGTTDDSAAINAAIAALYKLGGGDLHFTPGSTAVNSSIILNSFVRIIGEGAWPQVICNVSPCLSQTAGKQVIRAGVNYIRFLAGTVTNGTVLSFSLIQYSDIGHISFSGFTGSGAVYLALVTNPLGQSLSFDDSSAGPNIVFNTFHDFQGYETTVSTPLYIAGSYTASPPDILYVVTQNEFRSIDVWFTTNCISIIKAADSNTFNNILCATHTSSLIALLFGDPAFPASAVGVGTNHFDAMYFSGGGFVTSITLFGGYVTTWNDVWGWSSDIQRSAVTIDNIAISQGNCYHGGSADTQGGGIATMGFNDFCTSNTGYGSNSSGAIVGGPRSDMLLIYGALTSGGTVLGTATQGYRHLVLTNATVSTGTVQMPCAAKDGDLFNVTGTIVTSITTVTWAPCSTQSSTIYAGGVTSAGGASPIEFRYYGGSSSWIRVH